MREKLARSIAKASSIPEIDAAVSNDPRWELVQRVVSSSHFRASARLREFLLHVGECAIRNSPEEVTEQQIGIHVFQRSPGYNTSDDSIVRTHARLLRQKLSEYFSGEGAAEAVTIEIPKGHYLPVFQPAVPHSVPLHSEEVIDLDKAEGIAYPAPPVTPDIASTRLGKLWAAAAACSLIFLAVTAVWWIRPKLSADETGMNTLWGPFLSESQPLVIYSDALFARNPKDGLQNALFTGTGAVTAVRRLTQLFDAHHAAFILKRSRLVTWDDARSTNLIFIGSRASNSALNILSPVDDFTLLANSDSDGFVNLHPKRGEPAVYSRPKEYFNKDYAVVALLPGLKQGKWILVLSGLSPLGTEAAAEYACSPDDVAALLRAASFRKGEIRPFEALLETTIVGGVPMEAKLITIRTH